MVWAMLFAKNVPTDGFNDRSRTNPAGSCGGRIIIVDCAAGRIHPIERILRRAIGAVRNFYLKLPVIQTTESTLLINNAR